jgi:hypothetical protein
MISVVTTGGDMDKDISLAVMTRTMIPFFTEAGYPKKYVD